MKKRVELALQLSVIVVCLIVLANKWGSSLSSAQPFCNNQPTIKNNNDPWAWSALKANSWLPGTAYNKRQISVVIWDVQPLEAQKGEQVNEGIQTWNNYTGCAFVEFNTAIITTETQQGQPADDSMWVVHNSHQGSQHHPITDSNNQMIASIITIYEDAWRQTDSLRKLLMHEVGHSFGLNNAPGNAPTIMGNHYVNDITACDTEAIRKVYCPTTPTPTPTPEPTQTPDYPPFPWCVRPSYSGLCPDGSLPDTDGWCCMDFDDECSQYGEGWFVGNDGRTCVPPECAYCYASGGSYCSQLGYCWTPVLIDINGDGFEMTNARNGVVFSPDTSSRKIHTAWTKADSDDAWLVLDRNGNGTIDDGTELFGAATQQSTPPTGKLKNGFLALAEYDKAANGGNGDGKISRQDSIFVSLRLWQDANHNGISEQNELHTLTALDVVSIELDYKESKREDAHGNRFKYRAKVRDARGAKVSRWAWDVFPVSQSSGNDFTESSLNKKSNIMQWLSFAGVFSEKIYSKCRG